MVNKFCWQEDSGEQKMLLVRLPCVPLVKPNIKGGGLKVALPEGFMGKLVVYKSGAVKMKLGDVLCDVSRF